MEKTIIKLKNLPQEIKDCILADESFKDKGLELIETTGWIDNEHRFDEDNYYKRSIFKYQDKFWEFVAHSYGTIMEIQEVFPKQITVYE